jgi:uracil-DNA glycosylase
MARERPHDPRPVQPSAVPPGDRSLSRLAAAARGCQACDLWRLGTQTVFGVGRSAAELMLVGEQPGDVEDREGAPFVGPAGQLLDRALGEAEIDRSAVYLTNVVKHFKWRPSGGGKRRIHDKPNWTEIGACLPWLEAEVAATRPTLLVCLGATAAQAVIARNFKVTRDRGVVVDSRLGVPALATVHPSSILRSADRTQRREGLAGLVRDLKLAAETIARR